MPRLILPEHHIHPAVREKVANRHRDIVEEVQAAVATNDVVVVGMAQNPNPAKACRLLKKRDVPHVYLQYGSYLNTWRRRNALKLWSGWPTFPMIFVKGQLVGGASDLAALIDSGEFDTLLAGPRVDEV